MRAEQVLDKCCTDPMENIGIRSWQGMNIAQKADRSVD